MLTLALRSVRQASALHRLYLLGLCLDPRGRGYRPPRTGPRAYGHSTHARPKSPSSGLWEGTQAIFSRSNDCRHGAITGRHSTRSKSLRRHRPHRNRSTVPVPTRLASTMAAAASYFTGPTILPSQRATAAPDNSAVATPSLAKVCP